MTKETQRTAVTEPYKRTPAEAAAMNRFNERAARRPPARIKVARGKGCVRTRSDPRHFRPRLERLTRVVEQPRLRLVSERRA